jgi:LPS sulfotransferase NodH
VPDEYFEPLRATGLPRQARQYFEDPAVQHIAERLPAVDPGKPEARGSFEGWFSYVVQRGTTPNGVFGAKMMWNYFDDFRARVAELPGLGDMKFTDALDQVFPKLRIIFVRRRDKLSQAVSLWKAIQTQQWRNEAEGERDLSSAVYDYDALKFLVDELHRWDARWEDWFYVTGREPIRVIYEEFVGRRAATVGRVLDELGIDPPEPDGERGPMKPQSDEISRDWLTRFREDEGANALRP